MAVRHRSFEIRQVMAEDRDYLPALHAAVDAEPTAEGGPAPQVADLIATAERQGLQLDLVFAAYDDHGLATACAAVQSPGAAALVLVPRSLENPAQAIAVRQGLEVLHQAARARSIKLLQVLLEDGSTGAAETLRQVGFTYLTRLLYLRRRSARPGRSQAQVPEVSWVNYSDEAAPMFVETLEATYVQSLDCHELTGIRETSETLAGHRATGIFDPSLWWVVKCQQAPAGVLLLSRLPSQPALEIVYVGVAQPLRGTGLADVLLNRAITSARRLNAKELTLAVDARNTPARRMYARWDFRQVATRTAWIATPCRIRG